MHQHSIIVVRCNMQAIILYIIIIVHNILIKEDHVRIRTVVINKLLLLLYIIELFHDRIINIIYNSNNNNAVTTRYFM